jgi:dihydroorotate dehydrogenase (NAD+) catalytic subunit
VAEVSLECLGLRFSSPVVLASGPAGFGIELAADVDLTRVGAVTTKTITPLPVLGNPQPRLVDCPAGALNSIGLDNPGCDAFCHEILPSLADLKTQVIVSVTGPTAEETASVIERIVGAAPVRAIELNLSCPNVSGGLIGADAERVGAYVREVRRVFEGALLTKLPGDAGDLLTAAGAGLDAGADGVTLINSLRGMRVDWRVGRPFLRSVFGGLSGPAILPIALARVYDVRRAFPGAVIVGTGGVTELGSLVEMIMAGANLVGIGFGLVVDPQVGCRLTAELGRWLDERGIPTVDEIRSSAHEEGRRVP